MAVALYCSGQSSFLDLEKGLTPEGFRRLSTSDQKQIVARAAKDDATGAQYNLLQLMLKSGITDRDASFLLKLPADLVRHEALKDFTIFENISPRSQTAVLRHVLNDQPGLYGQRLTWLLEKLPIDQAETKDPLVSPKARAEIIDWILTHAESEKRDLTDKEATVIVTLCGWTVQIVPQPKPHAGSRSLAQPMLASEVFVQLGRERLAQLLAAWSSVGDAPLKEQLLKDVHNAALALFRTDPTFSATLMRLLGEDPL
jgi:hypothetical protein